MSYFQKLQDHTLNGADVAWLPCCNYWREVSTLKKQFQNNLRKGNCIISSGSMSFL